MENEVFQNEVMRFVHSFQERIPMGCMVGYSKTSEFSYEIAVINSFGQPFQIFTLYLDKGVVYYCHGQQFKTGEKAIN
ncbi:hypothetical protein ASwh1_103 [Aeromonas phage Aswh_1]|nr:hypothetical protein ASwh1_103 [Aeromonas phage Aswh_1]